MNEEWRKEMRAKMEGYVEQPPRVDWNEVERAVAERRKRGNRRNTVALWSRRAAAAAVAMLIVTATAYFFVGDKEAKTGAEQGRTALTTARTDGDNTAKDTTEDNRNTVTTTRKQSGGLMAMAQKTPHHTLPAAETETVDEPDDTQTYPAEETESRNIDPETSGKRTERQTSVTTSRQDYPTLPARRRRSGLAIGAYLANATTSSSTSGVNSAMMLNAADPIGKYDAVMSSDASNNIIRTPANSKTTVRHDQPIRIGLSLRYNIDDRWSIETGLSYTYLHSEITHSTENTTQTGTQRLHYVGIPAGVSYSFWRNKRLNLYATGNILAEKCVGGTVTVSHIQLSAGASLGAELNIQRGLGVYIEPGVSHYFDNNSDVPTIYKDKPTNVNLNIGLRMNLK